MISGADFGHQRALKISKENSAYGRVFMGGKVRTSDVRKYLGLFRDVSGKFTYYDQTSIYDENFEHEQHITQKQYNILKKLAVKKVTMMD